jgi:acyl-coenzyme A thioesterase PaaI-like protein
VTDAWYEVLDEADPGGSHATARVHATDLTNGPWQRGLQHAGPPAALLTRAVGRLGGGPPAALPARLSFDINAPVPTGDLVLQARMLRPGRRVAVAEAALAAADEPDRPLMSLRAWLIRRRHEPLRPQFTAPSAGGPPQEGEVRARPAGWLAGYLDTLEWRWQSGGFYEPGPATVWVRQHVRLVAGEEPTGIERLVAVADSASGISSIASPLDLVFVNTDLTLHVTREPVGQDLWMRAETVVDPTGIGRTRSELGDVQGTVGQGGQCLFVEPRAPSLDASAPSVAGGPG